MKIEVCFFLIYRNIKLLCAQNPWAPEEKNYIIKKLLFGLIYLFYFF